MQVERNGHKARCAAVTAMPVEVTGATGCGSDGCGSDGPGLIGAKGDPVDTFNVYGVSKTESSMESLRVDCTTFVDECFKDPSADIRPTEVYQ